MRHHKVEGAFKFRVDFENGISAAFSEVTGLDVEQPVVDYRMGVDPAQVGDETKRIVRVVLKRGIADVRSWNWILMAAEGDIPPSTVSVSLFDEARDAAFTWRLTRAWPSKTGPSLASGNNEVAIESLELAHEGIELDVEELGAAAGGDEGDPPE